MQSLALVVSGLSWLGIAPGAIAEIPSPRLAIAIAQTQIAQKQTAQEELEITESMLAEVAKQLNPSLPVQVNEQVRWDSVSAGPGKRLNLHYTAIDVTSRQLQGDDLTAFQRTFQDEVVSGSCQQSEVLLLLQNGIAMGIHLNGSDGRPISDFQFTAADCRTSQ